jgi:hypothetical protein
VDKRKAPTAKVKRSLNDSMASKYKSFPIGDISDVESLFQRSVTALEFTLKPFLKADKLLDNLIETKK